MRLGLDEERVSLADLELDLEEYESGDLASARRLRLGDILLPSEPIPPGHEVTIELPTLGPGLHRQLRLFDRDGLLLDATDRTPTVERVTLTIAADGAPPSTVTVGGVQLAKLTERLQRADQSDAAYRKMLEDGLTGRVVDDPATGLPALTALLRQAHGHLDIFDPYFGCDTGDWNVLVQVQVLIRVLTGRRVLPVPTGVAPAAPSVDVRKWRGRTPPWHDRIYLWSGGGLAVGTSPSGLGARVARLDRITASEADGWQRLFDAWWAGPNVQPI